MIYYLPLEPIENRYTKHLDDDISEFLLRRNVQHISIRPITQKIEIKKGSFLDAPNTIMYKAKQLAHLAEFYDSDLIKDEDIIWTSDLWFPGLESIAYLNYFCNKKVKLRGIMHAGSWTDTDYVRQIERYAHLFEDLIFDLVDRVYVGSQFVKRDILNKRIVDPKKIEVTGLPLDSKLWTVPDKPKKDIVIFNGRNVDEKQPKLFVKLQEELSLRGVVATYINTLESGFTKDQYYRVLSQAKVVVSFALQENFGYGIMEAVKLGCIPVVPDRLAYPEYYSPIYRYSTFEQCVDKVQYYLNNYEPPEMKFITNEQIFSRWFLNG